MRRDATATRQHTRRVCGVSTSNSTQTAAQLRTTVGGAARWRTLCKPLDFVVPWKRRQLTPMRVLALLVLLHCVTWGVALRVDFEGTSGRAWRTHRHTLHATSRHHPLAPLPRVASCSLCAPVL